MSRKKVTPKLRKQIADRAENRCEYCQSLKSYSPSPFNLEHILPISKGGLTTLLNLAFSCYGCNRKKSDKLSFPDPLNGELTPFYNPRQDNWNIHFAWSNDGVLIVGITPTGRATVEGLDLNREELINLRKLLATIDLHPPL